MKKNSGFTLLELIITVAVISIVMAFAIPSMRTFTQNDRLTTQINELVGHLAYARSEAVKRSSQVVVCESNNTTTCTGGTNWENGWLIFVDTNNDNALSVGEDILRARQLLKGNNTLIPAGGISTTVIYDYRGYATATSTGTFSLCDSRGNAFGKAIAITNTGRVRKEGAVTCP